MGKAERRRRLIYTSSEVALKSDLWLGHALISNLADIQVAHAQFVNLRASRTRSSCSRILYRLDGYPVAIYACADSCTVK